MNDKNSSNANSHSGGAPGNLRILTIAIVALSLITLLALGFTVWLQFRFHAIHEQYAIEREVSQLKVAQLSAQLAQEQFVVNDMQSKLHKVLQTQEKAQTDLILNKVRQLVQSARLYLNVEKDPSAALKLLNDADRSLAGFTHPSIVSVRKALADGITALQQLPKTDVADAALRIEKLNKILMAQLVSMPKNLLISEASAPKKTEEAKSGFWREFWQKTLNVLEKTFVIRKPQQPAPLFLTAAERQSLILNLQFQLGFAEWSILRHQGKIYQESIARTISTLQSYAEYFPSRDVEKIMHTLRDLQKINLPSELPNLDGVLEAIESSQAVL